MCRLLGIYGYYQYWKEVAIEFQKQAEYGMVPPEASNPGHKDGWGMTASNISNVGMKLLTKALGSALASNKFLETIKSVKFVPHVFLCHLRKASPNISIDLANTHPFFLNEWAFIHNGTVYEADQLSYDQNYPLTSNKSDSEYLFRHLLENLHPNQTISVYQTLIKTVKDLHLQFSALNYMMSNGIDLYVLRWAKTNFNYYSLYYLKDDTSLIFSSEPINFTRTEEISWKEIPNKTIIQVTTIENEIQMNFHHF